MGTAIRSSRVVVDLTPMLAGGANGGAKPFTLALLRRLIEAAPDMSFVMLTRESSQTELEDLEAENASRVCVLQDASVQPAAEISAQQRLRRELKPRVRSVMHAVLPGRAARLTARVYRAARARTRPNPLVSGLGADLLFCPFMAPLYYHPDVPVVAQVQDLQYAVYPQFFSAEQRHYRGRDFSRACEVAERLICMSDSVRQSILATGRVGPEQVVTIRPGLLERPRRATPDEATQVLGRLGLAPESFLLYPANFWPNKNHAMLMTAYNIFRTRHPGSDLRLVCTGHQDALADSTRAAAQRMGLADHVSFPGYVSTIELAALLASCRALVFPSLYEGFGLPLLEAMAFDKPILCSNVTSLPEVAGNAALYFDPRQPEEIVHAMEAAATNQAYLSELAEAGRKRLQVLGADAAATVDSYLGLFRQIAKTSPAVHR